MSQFPLTGPFLAGRIREDLAQDDLHYIEALVEDVVEVGDGARIVERAQLVDRSAILVDGFVLRTIENFEKRFIVGVNVVGDFVDLHGFALKRLDHNVVAAGAVTIGFISHERLRKAIVERPAIAHALWFATLLDASIHRKWIQMLEQLDAPSRIAHLYAELRTRLELVGANLSRSLKTPFTQADLADMCGVSAIHANRAVGKLRDLGLAQIRRGDLHTEDWDALRRFAQFNPDYLYCDGPLKLDRNELPDD